MYCLYIYIYIKEFENRIICIPQILTWFEFLICEYVDAVKIQILLYLINNNEHQNKDS